MSATIEWLSGWWNWIFLFPLMVGAIFILVDLVIGGVSEFLHAHVGIDLNGDGIPDKAIPDKAMGHHGHGIMMAGLLWLGVGKAPISVLLETLFISFGLIGLFINAVWSVVSPGFLLGLSFPFALVGAALGSLVLTRAVAGFIAKMLPGDSTITRRPGGFVGEAGLVLNTVTEHSGQVRIHGSGSVPDALISVKRDSTALTNIAPGRRVMVVGYLETTNTYTVVPMEEM